MRVKPRVEVCEDPRELGARDLGAFRPTLGTRHAYGIPKRPVCDDGRIRVDKRRAMCIAPRRSRFTPLARFGQVPNRSVRGLK